MSCCRVGAYVSGARGCYFKRLSTVLGNCCRVERSTNLFQQLDDPSFPPRPLVIGQSVHNVVEGLRGTNPGLTRTQPTCEVYVTVVHGAGFSQTLITRDGLVRTGYDEHY